MHIFLFNFLDVGLYEKVDFEHTKRVILHRFSTLYLHEKYMKMKEFYKQLKSNY